MVVYVYLSCVCVCVCVADQQALAELSAELLKHCQGETAPFSPVVGEPCCALFSGEMLLHSTNRGRSSAACGCSEVL